MLYGAYVDSCDDCNEFWSTYAGGIVRKGSANITLNQNAKRATAWPQASLHPRDRSLVRGSRLTVCLSWLTMRCWWGRPFARRLCI
jgi:hypothetical protein